MIALQEIHKAFGSQVIFDGARLQINPGDRLAFVGPNGAGKSTLFKLILGLEEADGGRIIKTQGLSLGYLPQENAPLGETTVLAETLTPLQAGEASDGMDLRREAEGKKILFGLEFRERDFAKPLSALSGGWRMRVALARLLLAQPDVLMLDEPTNHLDLDALLWFQNYLSRWKGSLLVISHDRAFVNAVVSAIVDVRGGQLYRYVGDYEAFLAQRELEEAQRLAAYKRQEKLIEDAEEFIRRFRAQASKAPQVQSRIKMLEKMELIELPPELKKVHIRFPQPTRTGQRVLSLHRVSKAYGETVVYRHLDMEFERGQKVALVGPNGAGKSTLLKLLAGVLAPDEGERRLGLNVEAGYYSQHRADMLDPERTVLEEALHTRRVHPELFVRTVLGTFLFQESAVFKKVKVLSGGEKSRLGLVKLLLDPPNVLLLDEPTTHLDLPSVEALVGALKVFEGTILFISHDLFFIRALADHTAWVPGEGRVVLYPGNYDYFLSRQNETASLPAVSMVEDRRQHLPAGVRSSAQDVQDWKASERARQRNRKRLNQRLRDIEDEREDLQARLGSVFVQSDYKKLMEIDGQLKALATEKESIVAQLAGDGVAN